MSPLVLLVLFACGGDSKESDSSSGASATDECLDKTDEGKYPAYTHEIWDDVCIDEGYACQVTCGRLHAEQDDTPRGCGSTCCNLSSDRTAADLLAACLETCASVVAVTSGEATYVAPMDKYDKEKREWRCETCASPGNGPPMVNRADAIVWGACIGMTSCENLDKGMCSARY